MLILSHASLDQLEDATYGLRVTGWLISPYLDHPAVERMCKIFQNLSRYDTASPDIKTSGLRRANDELSTEFAQNILLCRRSAALVGLMMSLPNTARFSHLYELAVMQRYRLELPAALMLALPLVEGFALAVSGWRFKDKQRSIREAVRAIVPSAHLSRLELRLFEILHSQLTNFIDEAYAHTSGGLGVANLNRHYIMHGLGEEPTSFPGNVARVFMALEVLAALDQLNAEARIALPDTATLPRVFGISREDYYEELVGDALSNVNLLKIEYLAHHPQFKKELYYGND